MHCKCGHVYGTPSVYPSSTATEKRGYFIHGNTVIYRKKETDTISCCLSSWPMKATEMFSEGACVEYLLRLGILFRSTTYIFIILI